MDAEVSIFGPSYDQLNARLLALEDQAVNEIVYPELARFKVEKEELQSKLLDELTAS